RRVVVARLVGDRPALPTVVPGHPGDGGRVHEVTGSVAAGPSPIGGTGEVPETSRTSFVSVQRSQGGGGTGVQRTEDVLAVARAAVTESAPVPVQDQNQPPSVQRVEAVPTVAVADTTVQRDAEPGAGGAPAAAAAGGAGEPEELLKKLFDPLLRRLKAELRVDRERHGVLTDLRH